MVGTGRRRKPAIGRKYTMAEKLAYWKSQALTGSGGYKTKLAKYAAKRALSKSSSKSTTKSAPAEEEEESGRSLAKKVGSKAVGWVWDQLFGSGAYAPMNFEVDNNSFMKEITANGPPSVWTTSSRPFVVRHREYLGPVISSSNAGAFSLASYAIQPGLPQTFPWLSNIARNFQQYTIKGMLFEFVSTSSDALNSTNTALGTVVMATNYNSLEADWTSKIQMMQTEFASTSKPSCSILHPIECKPELTTIEVLNVRTGAVPANGDIRVYDLGKFQIATVGCQGTSVNLGDLWVTYEISFLKPVQNVDSSAFLTDFYSATSGITASVPYGTNTVYAEGSNLGTTVTGQKIFITEASPGDQYLAIYAHTGTAVALNAPVVTSSNSDIKNFWQAFGIAGAVAPSTGVATSVLAVVGVIFKARTNVDPSNQPWLNIAYGSLLTSPDHADLLVTKINPQLLPQAAAMMDHITENPGEVEVLIKRLRELSQRKQIELNEIQLQKELSHFEETIPPVKTVPLGYRAPPK